MADPAPGTAPVIDRRPPPRGVLPRGTQTWLMVGLSAGILAIIVFAGRPGPASSAAPAPPPSAMAPNPDRLRDYQDRLRVMDERAREQTLASSSTTAPRPSEPCTQIGHAQRCQRRPLSLCGQSEE